MKKEEISKIIRDAVREAMNEHLAEFAHLKAIPKEGFEEGEAEPIVIYLSPEALTWLVGKQKTFKKVGGIIAAFLGFMMVRIAFDAWAFIKGFFAGG